MMLCRFGRFQRSCKCCNFVRRSAMKRVLLAVLCAIVLILFTACDTYLPYGRAFKIFKNHGSNWVSEDESIYIHINEDGSGNISFLIDGEEHKRVINGLYNCCYVFDEDAERFTDCWVAVYFPNSFRVKVEESEFFEKGTKIVFRKVKE